MENTRRVSRVLVRDVLEVAVGHDPYRALDLSTLGVRVRGHGELPEGSVQSLRLGGAESAPLLGRVVWCTPAGRHVQAGFEFVELTAADRVWIREWVEALQQAVNSKLSRGQVHLHAKVAGEVARWRVCTPTFGRWQPIGDGVAEGGRA